MFFPEADEELKAEIMKQMRENHANPECVYSNTRLPKAFDLEKLEGKDDHELTCSRC